jgi:hypothetical protein
MSVNTRSGIARHNCKNPVDHHAARPLECTPLEKVHELQDRQVCRSWRRDCGTSIQPRVS